MLKLKLAEGEYRRLLIYRGLAVRSSYKGFSCLQSSAGEYVIMYTGLSMLVYSPSRLERFLLKRSCLYETNYTYIDELRKAILEDIIKPNVEMAKSGFGVYPLNLEISEDIVCSCEYSGFEIWKHTPTGECIMRYTGFGHPLVVPTNDAIHRMCYLSTGLYSLSSVKELIKTKIRGN